LIPDILTPETVVVAVVVAAFSVVQSVFGMGVLVFGTPTLLLFGYDFVSILHHLLPASLAISLLQVFAGYRDGPAPSPGLWRLCLPGIAAGLWIVTETPLARHVGILIGLTLLISAVLRISDTSRAWLSRWVHNREGAYHLVMGLAHGLTNLGGALLAVYAGAMYVDKKDIRHTVATYYLAFGIVQVAVLGLTGFGGGFLATMHLALLSAAIYHLVGSRLFDLASAPLFQRALSAFLVTYGIVILVGY